MIRQLVNRILNLKTKCLRVFHTNSKLPVVRLSVRLTGFTSFVILFIASSLLLNSKSIAAEETAVLSVKNAFYGTFNAESNTWEKIEVDSTYDSGFWQHWEEHPTDFRYELTLNSKGDHVANLSNYYLVVNLAGSYEVLFDGKLIGMNGKVEAKGSGCEELQPGKNRHLLPIPSTFLTEGEHLIELIGHRRPKTFVIHHTGIHVVPFEELIIQERWHMINYGSYLVYFVFGVFFISTFLTKRESLVHFYLGTICLLFSTFALNKLAYYHLDLNYIQAAWALNLVYSVNYIISLLAHLLIFEALGFKKRLSWILLPIPIAFSWVLEGFDSFGVLKITYEWLTLIALLAVFLRRKYAITALIILSTLSLVYSMRLFDQQQFVIYFALFLYLLFSIALAFYKQNKEKQEAHLTNARLNLELIKNKIQPHFILNSITSAMEWIESNPKQGASFLNALAKEFEVLSRMTDQKLIPLGIEIDSCRNYLKVMEFRKKANYLLSTRSIDLNEMLPPSIIRNLLENAISHNSFGKQSVEFVLEGKKDGKRRIYTFRSPYSHQPTAELIPSEGTGIKYIKARLMESYKNRWNYSHGPKDGEWITTIEIY